MRNAMAGFGARAGFGLALAGLGLIIALFPFYSIWSVGGQALDQLPTIVDDQIVDDRHRLGALLDGEMIVATRTYETLTASDIEQALTQAGFDVYNQAGFRWHTASCCGEWDGVQVRTEDRPGGGSIALITMSDGDIQATWPLLLLLGLPIFVLGTRLALVGRGDDQRAPATSELSGTPPSR